MRTNIQSISESSSFTTPEIGVPGQPARLHVVSRGKSRASNDALAWLAVQDVTPGVHDFGVYLAKKVRFATTADGRRKAKLGEVMCYPLQATMARERGCSVRQVKRLVRSLREVGLEVRQRVRPYGATYVFPVPSDVPSDVPSQREPRTEPRTEKKVRTVGRPTTFPPKRAEKGQTKQQRLVAAICWKLGFWPSAARLEQFDESPNTEKQALIKRLLRAEARHDRRAAQRRDTAGLPTAGKTKAAAKDVAQTDPPAPNVQNLDISAKKQKVQVEPFQGRPRSGRLLAEYAERLRVARKYQRSDGSWANLTGGAV